MKSEIIVTPQLKLYLYEHEAKVLIDALKYSEENTIITGIIEELKKFEKIKVELS